MGLNLKTDGIYVDATLGYAGDSSEILKRVKKGFLFAFDQDSEAITWSNNKLKQIGNNYEIIKSNFLYMKEELISRNISGVDGILFDLGVSSPQLDEDYRGFSFHKDAKLDMRMNLDSDFSAIDVVNSYDEKRLADIIFRYGEEKYAKSIAKNIVIERAKKPIETTFELVEIIKKSMPYKEMIKAHPARRTFQAIRIEVNHELDILESSIRDAFDLLKVGGRLCVITFHSLEDKIVAHVFNDLCADDERARKMPIVPEELKARAKKIAKITPSKEELEDNLRSRSSKLRVIERIK
jgi:16S rRNA (cytosine1402-N4)-methyltransferase